jgi:hypothetical protein
MLSLLPVLLSLLAALALYYFVKQRFDQPTFKITRKICIYLGVGLVSAANILFIAGLFLYFIADLEAWPISGLALAAAVDIIALGLVFSGAFIFSFPLRQKMPKKGKLQYAIMLAMSFVFILIFNVGFYFVQGPIFEEQRILQIGLPGRATLLEIEPTGVTGNEQPRVHLLLEVWPDQGASYETEIYMVISPVHLPKFVPGAVFNIKYDPEDKNKIALESVVETRQ